MMVPEGKAFDPADRYFRLTAVARCALACGRPALPHESLKELLKVKFNNPILGLFAAYLHLLEEPDAGLLERITDSVAGMIGEDFPDVIALRMAAVELRGGKSKNQKGTLRYPPLLRASWDLISRDSELLRAGSMLREVASGVIPGRPWLAWTPEARSQKRDSAAVRGFAVVERAAKSHPDDGALESLLTRGVEMPSEAVRGLMEFIKKQGQVERNPMSRGVAESTARYGADARIEGTPTNDAALALEIIKRLPPDVPWGSLHKKLKAEATEARDDGGSDAVTEIVAAHATGDSGAARRWG